VVDKNKEGIKSLDVKDFESCFGTPISKYVQDEIEKYNFSYCEAGSQEFQRLVIFCLEALKRGFKENGIHRQQDWQKGWSENWQNFSQSKDLNDLSPKYCNNNKDKTLRFNGRFIRPEDPKFEQNTHSVVVSWLADSYMRDVDSIYEFGCGTGQNFLSMRSINPNAKLIGTDWAPASGKILTELKDSTGIKCEFSLFDFFNPDRNLKIQPNSAVITVTALEQIGKNFNEFLNYLIENKPRVCIHVEPIIEFLDPDNSLLDYCTYHYMKKRNYLDGFYKKLKNLERDNIIEIISENRVRLGGFWTEGLSTIVWKVK
jgi:SAM-dependent methyltransferase